MKFIYTLTLVMLSMLSAPSMSMADSRIYMVGKVKILATTYTQVVLFYDRGITSMADCHREVQRGNHGQWRFHHHKFDNPHGYRQRIDYYCVQSAVEADPWYNRATYDHVYKIDIRSPQMKITPAKSYSDCLSSVRREVADETSKFFCAKLSQSIKL